MVGTWWVPIMVFVLPRRYDVKIKKQQKSDKNAISIQQNKQKKLQMMQSQK